MNVFAFGTLPRPPTPIRADAGVYLGLVCIAVVVIVFNVVFHIVESLEKATSELEQHQHV